MVPELLSGTQNFKLTKQRSRGTVRAGKDAILWGTFVAQSSPAALAGAVRVKNQRVQNEP